MNPKNPQFDEVAARRGQKAQANMDQAVDLVKSSNQVEKPVETPSATVHAMPEASQSSQKASRGSLFDKAANVLGSVADKALHGVRKGLHAIGDHHPDTGGEFDPDCKSCQKDLHTALSQRGPGITGYVEGGQQ